MVDGKKFLFLSNRQRTTITAIFICMLTLCSIAIYLAASKPALISLLQPSVELLKLILAGSGGWGLIVLYASSNSQNRIKKETLRFFDQDITNTFHENGYSTTPATNGLGVQLIRNMAGSAVFALSNQGERVLLLWCRLNVYELSIVFLLPPQFAHQYQNIYEATLKGFERTGTAVDCFGVQTHDVDGGLPTAEEFLELYVYRRLPPDFLFDAASRMYAANQIYGDARSFLMETIRTNGRHSNS
ncbi:MAG TPA: hypothetical protein VL001_14190 [Candidimonas sp.]|nr:hypothetical protein [Candidimonas sp.]